MEIHKGQERKEERESEGCIVNVRIAAGFAKQGLALSSVVQSAPCVPCSTAMAERNDFEETRRRIAADRARLQAIAKKNSEKAKERMRLKQEAAEAADKANSAAQRAAKAVGVVLPKAKELTIKAPTRPPPRVPSGTRGGTSSAAASRTLTPPSRRTMSPSSSFASSSYSFCTKVSVGYTTDGEVTLGRTCVSIWRLPRSRCCKGEMKWWYEAG